MTSDGLRSGISADQSRRRNVTHYNENNSIARWTCMTPCNRSNIVVSDGVNSTSLWSVLASAEADGDDDAAVVDVDDAVRVA